MLIGHGGVVIAFGRLGKALVRSRDTVLGTHRVRVSEVYFFRFRDGRITHAWGLEDNAERMRQLGHLGDSSSR